MNDTRDFNQAAQTWDDNPMRVKLARAIADAIIAHVPLSESMHVLDYGAGTGLVTLALQPHVRSIVAADSSQGMLAKLDEKIAASAITSLRTVLLDLETDPALEQRFDLIVSSMTTHHLQDVAGLIQKFHDMLSADGYLAIADLDLDGGEFHLDPTGVKHNGFDRKEIEQLFAQAGFCDVKIETAHTISRAVQGEVQQEFTVFLAAGRKKL